MENMHAVFVVITVMTVSILDCNFFLSLEICSTNCYNLPDKFRLEGCITSYLPPPFEVSALIMTPFQANDVLLNIQLFQNFRN